MAGEIEQAGMKWITRRMPRAMEALGMTAAAKVSASIDTKYPPASKPGESPHKRTGNLQASVDHAETTEGDEYTSTITSARVQDDPRVPEYLEFGTSKMAARPYMRPVRNEMERTIPAVFKRSMSSEATYATSG